VTPSRMTYDVLDRTTSITLPDGTATTTSYGFGADRAGATRFQTATTDANGKLKRVYRSVREQTTSLQEFNGAQVIWTSYRYDPLDQLIEVSDDQNNLTTTSYDKLGRRTAVETEDTGRTETVFDLASNPIAKITANLRAEGKRIEYDHDFNRLAGIRYPNHPGNNVSYTYGAPGATDNRAGRITRVTDESGAEERFYGRLGEITKEIKSIASDTGPEPEVYTSTYTYDTFGRLQSMVYPDGEQLTYRYDSGGMVAAASGVKGSHSYTYVERLEYDKFEQRAFMDAGNNVRTSYTYDALDRRLVNLRAGKGGSPGFQNINYTYDNVGNILRLANDIPVPPPSQDGGPTVQTFAYDDLYRLTGATGVYQFAPDKSDRYTLSMSYDTIHNAVSKTQRHWIVEPSGTEVTQHKTTYDFAYQYGVKPHASTHIGQQTYTYDANGNQLGWTDDGSGQRRTIAWDDENRMQSLFDNGHEKTYKYDDSGQRVIKRGPQGETAYVSQFFTMRNREIGTKHVFVGTTRLVSKLVKQDKPGANPGGTQPLEKDQYYFHADHIGSSNYVTDANGEIYQHTEYFPGGETWVDESSNKQRTPYRFSGKELDEETGLYYYGSRYYDPRTTAWQSADVDLDRYLGGLSQGGVYNSFNLNLYAYGYQNPVKYTDPNGRAVETVWDAFNIGLGVASFVKNVREGNYGSAAVDALGVVVDTAATVVPGVPGGAGSVIKAARAADAGVDVLKAADRTADLARAADRTADAAKAADRTADAAKAADRTADGAKAADRAGDAARHTRPVNKAGVEYPNVIDPRTGKPIPHPGEGLTKVDKVDRVPWTNKERGEFIKEWYDRGHKTPEGGWANYDIHHIKPREYGGTNSFDNLVPVPRSTHQKQFNPWWANY
jgi:RHS repeat-associated protein